MKTEYPGGIAFAAYLSSGIPVWLPISMQAARPIRVPVLCSRRKHRGLRLFVQIQIFRPAGVTHSSTRPNTKSATRASMALGMAPRRIRSSLIRPRPVMMN